MNFEVAFYILLAVCGALGGVVVYMVGKEKHYKQQFEAMNEEYQKNLDELGKLRHTADMLRLKIKELQKR